ncbi:laminin subunit alpha-3 isoform X1 [Gadus morhua]|uniref:laminin subunit alpha-3 isoform X1 n=1 Tax=Gadus morhua TaxID=8049 RepID=UPI0011B8590A|nr:laminin subunit alpha-3 isoform X1 [Gadus morhua]
MARRMEVYLLFFILFTSFCRHANGQVSLNEITGFSLSPPYFNLAQGSDISATATCGQDDSGSPRSDLYCKLVGGHNTGFNVQNIQGQFCDHCNSNEPNKAHPVTNAIDGTERWWQSPPLSRGPKYNQVNITLDLGQLYHVAYILIKFANSPRPDLWVLERSVDNGKTYRPWQYFAHSKHECVDEFGKQPNRRVEHDGDQICTTEYSKIPPLENGEIVVSLINGRPGSSNFTYSPVLRDFTKATNIRLRFLRTSTLLGHLISKAQRDPTVTRRYYYSIKDISVGGRCVCHGHAQECGVRGQANSNRRHCECTHNTCGESCDRCCPGFNQRAWRAATADSPNACQPCQCFSHAFDCYYDPEVERRGASLDSSGGYGGGGVCIGCQHNTAGVNCEKCAEGFYRPHHERPESGCIPCSCDPSITAGCEMGSGRCICKPGISGHNCDLCADGYYGYPQCVRDTTHLTTTISTTVSHANIKACPVGYFGPPSCQQCVCDFRGTVSNVCDASGRCLCRQGVEGPYCERCRPGHHSFPGCQGLECRCDGAGAADPPACDPTGRCLCLGNYAGERCDRCAQGYYGYPDCAACQCSREGSYGDSCDHVSGQCLCNPGVAGQRCDRCAGWGPQFPRCETSIRQCNPAGSDVSHPQTGPCRCLANVEGTFCDRCKPLYWKLTMDNPEGCTECMCDLKGTLSGVGECQQKSGQCHCKPHTCGPSCDTCKEGFYLLQKRNYFGCQGCECDVGGATGMACDFGSGQCRCRKNIVGRTCSLPAPSHYFPSLHQLKYEVEDGVTPNSRPVRFGFEPRVFPGFSWRGYAVLSPAQSDVRVKVHVEGREARESWYRLVLRYSNPSGSSVTGTVEATGIRAAPGSQQSQEVVFPAGPGPAFLTVPGDGFAQPFVLTPGNWFIHIRAQGVLLDYLVLLPRDFYQAPLLQDKITQPCNYSASPDGDTSCLLYKHVGMDGFSWVLGSQGRLSSRGGRRRRQARVRRLSPEHPPMATLSGRQSTLQLNLRVSRPGPHAVVLEYASEADMVQNVNLVLTGHSSDQIQARANIYSCSYSFLCRSVAVGGNSRVTFLQLEHRNEILLHASSANFLLFKVYAVPAEDFSMDYVQPRVLCVSVHGRFTDDSQYCLPSQFPRPASAWVLDAAREGRRSPSQGGSPQRREGEDWRLRRQTGLLPLTGPPSEGVLLKSPQTEISFRPRVPVPGRYVVVLHYRQPEHPSFPVGVLVEAGRAWNGSVDASFCPSVSGCREVVVASNRIALEFEGGREPTITVKIPPGKTLTLDYVLVVADDSYSPDLLREKPLNKSAEFITRCRGEGFHIDPRTSSEFCRSSAHSLVAAYNDGALPCDCDESGTTLPACDPDGGQCTCRPNVIGRRCSKCATGYYGFPYCRPCGCGRRLCDEVTGRCICPPQTVKPSCDVCDSQTFSFHPLLGCEGCDCSPTGVRPSGGLECDNVTGQCPCKPRIGGRQCNRCAAGYHGYPDCRPCDCNQSGVTPDVCHPDTGRCLCKRNVGGARCDVCKGASFHFEPSNPEGCTRCFCFGATDQCQSSGKHRGKFMDMRDWRLEKPDQNEVASTLNPASNTVVADVQELSPVTQVLHWVAPPSYLGDRVLSYGGFLTFQSKSFGVPAEGMKLMDRSPDIILSGQGMTLVHQGTDPPTPDRLHHGRVQLVEGLWRHALTNRPVSREELMMVLADLEGLRIRGLYFTQSQRLSLGEVGLETASDRGPGAPAGSVEQCVCPPEYAGDSCQKCSPGYYRDGSGLYLGRCVRCECNGLSSQCEDKTGRCQNCDSDAAGPRCELCKEGYYGNPALRSCRVCPCPFNVASNSFALGCKEGPGGFQCVCKEGYAGERCEKCAPGFYGDPMMAGGSCRPCNCHGNGNSCDPSTGVCKNTEPGDTNTEGQCQECDSCAQALLADLERLDDELTRIKGHLENASASADSYDRLSKLEKAISETKILLNKFNNDIESQKPKVAQLEQDVETLNDDISTLKAKADKQMAVAKKAVQNAEKTEQRAQDLHTDIKEMLKKIQALLKELMNSDGGDSQSPDLSRQLDEAQRLVKEMEKRNFNPQKAAAEKEREEARKLLDFIKADVSKQCDTNQAAADKIKGQLKGFEAKLKDLERTLKQAEDNVKKASTQNGLNDKSLKELLLVVEDVKKERKAVEDMMEQAEDELQKTEVLATMLADSKKEYEQLAAQLDGAKRDLTQKVNEISQAANKEDLVIRAEEHADKLSKMAMDLQNAVGNASGRTDVRDAIDAINAYKNITDAINAAEAAANEAKAAADKALKNVKNADLTERAKELKTSGIELLKDAKDSQDDLKAAEDDLSAQKKRLKNADIKKKALDKDLMNVQAELDNINRDDIGDMIDEAKRKAARASTTTANTQDRLNNIKDELDKIKVTPGDSNINDLMDEVDQSVRDLLNQIPTLEDKLSEMENLSSQFLPVSNITENIKKIKELIEQARDAANRIRVPMKFMGDGYVELHTPTDLDDLKAYTELSLSLQRPLSGRGDGKRRRRQVSDDPSDMFVMYLGNRNSTGDFIGMAVRQHELYFIYRLHGRAYEIKTGTVSRSLSNPAIFDKVVLQRIYQDAQVTYTEAHTSREPKPAVISTKQGDLLENLLSLNPSDVVFYVGGFPADFTPPASLNYPMYRGCIEFSSFNERFFSLYNFKEAVKINREIPCKRHRKSTETKYFEGTGYAKLAIGTIRGSFLLLEQSLNTRSVDGLLFYIGNQDKYYTLAVESGYVVIHSDQLDAPARSKKKIFPVADSADILIIFDSKNNMMKVRIGNDLVVEAAAKYDGAEFVEYYIGGVSSDVRERNNITIPAIKGCIRNIKTNKESPVYLETVGVSRGCRLDLLAIRKAEFDLGSSLAIHPAPISLDRDVSLSLGFRSTEDQGLILEQSQVISGLKLELSDGCVKLRFGDKVFKSFRQYNDGQWHYLTVTKSGTSIELLIDELRGAVPQPNVSFRPDPNSQVSLGKDIFKGCISNVYLKRPDHLYRPEDLSTFQSSGSVELGVCSPERPPMMILDTSRQGAVQAVQTTANALPPPVSECTEPASLQHAYRMGAAVSSLRFSLPPQALLPKPHFSLEVRTRSPDGLLFFAATRRGNSHMAVYMSKGRIRFSVGKNKEIFNREKYNDGKWHSVMFSLEKKKFRLIVDGIRAQDGQLTSNEVASLELLSPLYLGSAPESLHQYLKQKSLRKHSVLGCLRNFQMNGRAMLQPTTNHGAGPCFDGPLQSGAYFPGSNAHVVYEDDFVVGEDFELLFDIRPRNLTGVLLHVGNFSRAKHGASEGHHLSLYMLKGEVIAQVNNGAGEFSVSVMPKTALCDGTFHKISVIKQQNVVQLHVDTVDNHKIGPPSSVTTLTRGPLYVGGIPESPRKQPSLPVSSSFVGCIQDMTINGKPVYFERLSKASGAVNLRECPAG